MPPLPCTMYQCHTSFNNGSLIPAPSDVQPESRLLDSTRLPLVQLPTTGLTTMSKDGELQGSALLLVTRQPLKLSCPSFRQHSSIGSGGSISSILSSTVRLQIQRGLGSWVFDLSRVGGTCHSDLIERICRKLPKDARIAWNSDSAATGSGLDDRTLNEFGDWLCARAFSDQDAYSVAASKQDRGR